VRLPYGFVGPSAGTGVRPLRHQLGTRLGWRRMELASFSMCAEITQDELQSGEAPASRVTKGMRN
jgi:hypothetical protein